MPSGRSGGRWSLDRPRRYSARFAALNATLMTRTAAVIALGESAASTDPELAEYRDQAHAETRTNLRALAAELKARGVLAPGISGQDAADTIYALATDESVYLRLTGECGWTPARYAELIARTLTAALTHGRPAERTVKQRASRTCADADPGPTCGSGINTSQLPPPEPHS